MNIATSNLKNLATEFNSIDPDILIETNPHNGTHTMVTLTHTGTVTRRSIGLALDFSGSMGIFANSGTTKKKVMIAAAQAALGQMYSDDMVTVVVYGTHAATVMKNCRIGNPNTIPTIVDKLQRQPLLGQTNPSAALHLLKHCDQTLLLSDGEFNNGPTSPVLLHKILSHPLICGSIYPGTDMTQLAEISSGAAFMLDCNEPDAMHSKLAAAMCAPEIRASGVQLLVNSDVFNLPSIRNGCSIRYVFPGVPSSFAVSYIDNRAERRELTATVHDTGLSDPVVANLIKIQKAVEIAEQARVASSAEQDDLRRQSQEMFADAGIVVERGDVFRISSQNRLQFSVEPSSHLCPTVCREASVSVQ